MTSAIAPRKTQSRNNRNPTTAPKTDKTHLRYGFRIPSAASKFTVLLILNNQGVTISFSRRQLSSGDCYMV